MVFIEQVAKMTARTPGHAVDAGRTLEGRSQSWRHTVAAFWRLPRERTAMVGPDRVRADDVGQQLVPVPGLATSTAAGLAMRVGPGQWDGVETGLAAVSARMLTMLPAPRRAVLERGATIDIDATDVEV